MIPVVGIVFGVTFVLFYVLAILSIVLTPTSSRGCPKCGRFSGLRHRSHSPWSWLMSKFHGGIHRSRCQYCNWRGKLRG